MYDSVQFVRSVKKNVLGGYVRFLDRLDPEFSRRVLSAQREFFLAGRAFFDEEARHAEKAIHRMEARMKTPEEPGQADKA